MSVEGVDPAKGLELSKPSAFYQPSIGIAAGINHPQLTVSPSDDLLRILLLGAELSLVRSESK